MKGTTNNEFLFYSLPQIHSQNEKSSLAAYCKLKLPDDMELVFYGHAFRFDPIDKVFKVVSPIAGRSPYGCIHNILTLGTLEMRWRKIQCSLSHNASSRAICINGAFYYLATGRDHASYIVCFDVQSENFKFIQAEFYNPRAGSLINYKGKIGVVSWPGHNPSGYYWELRIWVLEDVVKGAWSEYAYTAWLQILGHWLWCFKRLRSWSDCHGGNCFVQGVLQRSI
ncbi:hypothetical protein DY000_02060349 [Brassica cretica]|uniref:F-box associated beta-propeller type 3 domain-containing protein n=1 Tax=Brassica cretica TaxID=69181 RepID=A0ABQ7AV35_BRACR|nr:hypothetical protein DY000_02060349 [Brassica cretica]